MEHDPPLLTVAIPTYNSAHFLPDTLMSVFKQCIDDIEIVLVDNGSTDNTAEVVQAFLGPKIRYHRNEMNVGSRVNHNISLSLARGKYIKWVHADDVLIEGLFEKQLEVLEKHPNVSLVTCDMQVTDEHLNPTSVSRLFPGHHPGRKVINVCLSGCRNLIGGPTNFMFRRSFAEGLELSPDYHFVSDLRFGLLLLLRGDYVNINQIGYYYRRHAGTDTVLSCPTDLQKQEYQQLITEFKWWNPLNLYYANRYGIARNRDVLRMHGSLPLGPARLVDAVTAAIALMHQKFAIRR